LRKRGFKEVTGGDLEPILPLSVSEIAAEAREVWENLHTGRSHKDKGGLCVRACCLCAEYHRTIHPGRGRRLTAETFFLEWLAHDLLFWFRRRIHEYGKDGDEFDEKIIKRVVWDPVKGKSNPMTGAVYVPFLPGNFLKTPRSLYKQTGLFIGEHLRDLGLDESAKRIRIKVWRLRKSGLLRDLERRLIYSSAGKRRRRPGTVYDIMRAIADHLMRQPGHSATRRDLMRHLKISKDDFKSVSLTFMLANLPILLNGRRFLIMRTLRPRASVLYSFKEERDVCRV
jgi:hypothetical protein